MAFSIYTWTLSLLYLQTTLLSFLQPSHILVGSNFKPFICTTVMAAEQVLKVLDSYWLETTFLTNKTPSMSHQTVDPISQTKVMEVLPLDTNLLELQTLGVGSFSNQNLGSRECIFSDSPSPNSVLAPQKQRTILFQRDVREFSVEIWGNHEKEYILTKKKQSHINHRRKGKTTNRNFRRWKGLWIWVLYFQLSYYRLLLPLLKINETLVIGTHGEATL